jgi:hypothetical protein
MFKELRKLQMRNHEARELAEKRAWQISDLKLRLRNVELDRDRLREKYAALVIEQQKDKALWMALCLPENREGEAKDD